MSDKAASDSSNCGSAKPRSLRTLVVIAMMALVIASVVSHLVGRWVGIPTPSFAYRRIGPVSGPQVFCAGSSLVQFGLSWPEVTRLLGQGIENWGIGGSTPEVWEVSQAYATNYNRTLVGISLYDLNEHRLCDARAELVPFTQTVRDLWQSHSSWSSAKQLLSQYPRAYLRYLFPTAGRSEAVMVGMREQGRKLLRLSSASEDQARALVLPSQPVLEFGESKLKLSELSEARLLRRLAMTRSEIQGKHAFDGPKMVALKRLLERAHRQGEVIIVVLPVSPAYANEFLTPEIYQAFDAAIATAAQAAPGARIVRLDKLPQLQSNENFSDLVHLNSLGRRHATEAFVAEMKSLVTHP